MTSRRQMWQVGCSSRVVVAVRITWMLLSCHKLRQHERQCCWRGQSQRVACNEAAPAQLCCWATQPCRVGRLTLTLREKAITAARSTQPNFLQNHLMQPPRGLLSALQLLAA